MSEHIYSIGSLSAYVADDGNRSLRHRHAMNCLDTAITVNHPEFTLLGSLVDQLNCNLVATVFVRLNLSLPSEASASAPGSDLRAARWQSGPSASAMCLHKSTIL